MTCTSSEKECGDLQQRREMLQQWLSRELGCDHCQIEPASEDASFRRYFRVSYAGKTHIVMDAPPDKEDCQPFVAIARAFIDIGLNVPAVSKVNLQQGFLLLGDLGSQPYLGLLNEQTVDRLYGDALGALAVIQGCGVPAGLLPAYDHNLLINEMQLFHDWLLEQHCQIHLDDKDKTELNSIFELLADNALQQPQVCVHRDYHSRNLMYVPSHNPGVLDFQDAVTGPVTYDLVSLLRDCYIAWPQQRVENWALGYRELAIQTGILRSAECDEQQFLRWFDLMGVQRHLKAAGIFARLKHRDDKDGYLQDIPRTLGYVSEVCLRYDELGTLGRLVERVTGLL